MVRLVFRPYTQIRRSICTLESLRASTRVSPGFALHRHSSPSFGSQQICSHSNLSSENHDRSMVQALLPSHRRCCHPLLSLRTAGLNTRVLAYMLDSLVRVSRRVGDRHFVNIVSHFYLSRQHGTDPGFKQRTPANAGPMYLPRDDIPRRQLMLTLAAPVKAPPVLPAAASLLAISSPLHSLFKVLFIFPSRYLFAIGLLLIFSFRWNLPPTLSCTHKQLDSMEACINAK